MPQMAPMSWLSLFLLFSMIFILFNCLNYYSFNYTPKKFLMEKVQSKLNWKW
uniref:ATP synthase complex subunit 8 n=1 Tax=Omorgus chinensis TaxID=2841931 RepID=A0A8F0JWA2_9SCAR|nr:ATP synthase F0 subunit 8 [Omorgus chinensis]UFR81804.1 ATP synthase F0 subunit 8 [Trogidae sp.]